MNATLYVNRTGIPWEYLPHDFPPFKTVYDYFAKWEADETIEQVHDLLRDAARRANARTAEPSAAVVDVQSVKTSGNVAETSQGIGAARRSKGASAIWSPTPSVWSWPSLSPPPRSTTSAGGKQGPDRTGGDSSQCDQGVGRRRLSNQRHPARRRLRIDVEVVRRPKEKGFQPLPKK
ncbi:transposase, partial [Streptomyces hydrogenans]|uniref:transposase n=1 Tax=Streptomyces hydrogenans TaxID=1873719 RepID=UPI0021F5CB53